VLKGASAGASVRWASESVMGFVRRDDGNLDIHQPFRGPETLNVDVNMGYSRRFGRVKWDMYVNVYNLFNQDDPQPRRAVTTTASGEPSVTSTYLPAPRMLQIRNTFTF
jgi:outer membrane receptor protein involved in Fe transport